MNDGVLYPFTVSRQSFLKRGDYWLLPLSDGSFGAACVLSDCQFGHRVSQRPMSCGVLHWISDNKCLIPDSRLLVAYAGVISANNMLGLKIYGHLNDSQIDDSILEAKPIGTWRNDTPSILAHGLAKVGIVAKNVVFKTANRKTVCHFVLEEPSTSDADIAY